MKSPITWPWERKCSKSCSSPRLPVMRKASGSSVNMETLSDTDSEACWTATAACDDLVSYPGVGVARGLCTRCLPLYWMAKSWLLWWSGSLILIFHDFIQFTCDPDAFLHSFSRYIPWRLNFVYFVDNICQLI